MRLREGAELFFSSITPGAITSYITNPNFIYLLGLVGDELAGVVAIRDEKHLYHLFVASKFQRSGVGSFLWMHAKARALESGNADGFTVNSTPFAVPVYERFGFQIQGALVEEKGVAFVPMKLPVAMCLANLALKRDGRYRTLTFTLDVTSEMLCANLPSW